MSKGQLCISYCPKFSKFDFASYKVHMKHQLTNSTTLMNQLFSKKNSYLKLKSIPASENNLQGEKIAANLMNISRVTISHPQSAS